ncbi:hypothetical protein PTTG_12607 [Puccinia triticina 1-1 BBBD Race 1]|uniref:Uncharacterized protein n=1 Tax=Puccinia triticina (isolate 1-1 / race 1 (BBBD)) TaxID=630390 RepID=A0A180G2H5_PUCT1|nr:hypothetical protein PTTG_12607 [Puccinia triticina 1-1 BBBD Race 1]
MATTHDDDRLHRQLMGRASPSQTELRHSHLGLTTAFIDPLSPYPLLSPPAAATATRPSSRSSSYSLPHRPLASPAPSLASRHSSAIRTDLYNAAALLHPPPVWPPSAQLFDPDREAERVRLAKLEQRRSLALARPPSLVARNSSEGSIRSVHSFRSVGARHSKPLPSRLGSVYRPSPLRSASTPALVTLEAEAAKKKQRKEMKEEYQKMRAARIEEEKAATPAPQPGWFATPFKRAKAGSRRAVDGRRSTSQSSASASSRAPSSASPTADDGSHSTVPTSVEEGSSDEYLELGRRPKNAALLEEDRDPQIYDSPPVDPFRKSIMPGQVPPTPTKQPRPAPPKPPARATLRSLARLLDSFKIGPGQTDDAPAIALVQARAPLDPADAGWRASLKSFRKPRPSLHAPPVPTKRRKSIGALFFPPPPTCPRPSPTCPPTSSNLPPSPLAPLFSLYSSSSSAVHKHPALSSLLPQNTLALLSLSP